jgi:hypothetical protein
MTSTMMLIGRSVGNVTRQKVWNSFAAVDRGRLLQRRVDGLQPGQVQDHHVPDVLPTDGGQHRPDVDVRVTEPVGRVAGAPENAVQGAVVARVHELRDEPDDRERQHDGHVDHALVEPAEPQLLVQEPAKNSPSGVGDQAEEREPEQVVPQRRPERRVVVDDVVVVLAADPRDVADCRSTTRTTARPRRSSVPR